jgi:hypothetical protein
VEMAVAAYSYFLLFATTSFSLQDEEGIGMYRYVEAPFLPTLQGFNPSGRPGYRESRQFAHEGGATDEN